MKQIFLRIQLLPIAILFSILVGIIIYPRYKTLDSPDFKVFYTAAQHSLHNPQKIYSDSPDRFLYAPIASTFFIPFTWLPSWEANQIVWYIVTLLIFFLLVSPSWQHMIAAIILLRYFVINLRYGQINLFVLLLMFLTSNALRANKAGLPGSFSALSTWLKIFPCTQMLEFILRKRYQEIILFLACSTAFFLLPFLIWDTSIAWELYRQFPQELVQKGIPVYSNNQSILVLLLRFFHVEGFVLFPQDYVRWKIMDISPFILKGTAIIFGGYLSYLAWRKAHQRQLNYDYLSASCFSILYLSHLVWKPYFIFLFPALVQSLSYKCKMQKILIASYILIGPLISPDIYGKNFTAFCDGLSLHMWASLILFYLWLKIPKMATS